jgi:hypothetical protein
VTDLVQWTKGPTWLGGIGKKRDCLHRIPRRLGSNYPQGTTLRGWIVVVLAILVLVAILLVEELVF